MNSTKGTNPFITIIIPVAVAVVIVAAFAGFFSSSIFGSWVEETQQTPYQHGYAGHNCTEQSYTIYYLAQCIEGKIDRLTEMLEK